MSSSNSGKPTKRFSSTFTSKFWPHRREDFTPRRLAMEASDNLKYNEPAHEIMALFALRKLILQMRMCSHPVGLDVWFLVGTFAFFQTSCVQTARALARLHRCTGSPGPSLVAYVISTTISWAGSNNANDLVFFKILVYLKTHMPSLTLLKNMLLTYMY